MCPIWSPYSQQSHLHILYYLHDRFKVYFYFKHVLFASPIHTPYMKPALLTPHIYTYHSFTPVLFAPLDSYHPFTSQPVPVPTFSLAIVSRRQIDGSVHVDPAPSSLHLYHSASGQSHLQHRLQSTVVAT